MVVVCALLAGGVPARATTSVAALLQAVAERADPDGPLAQRLAALTPEQMTFLTGFVGDTTVLEMAATLPPATSVRHATGARGARVVTAPYTPQFPSGSGYDVWVATLVSGGHLSDSDGDGATNDESCSAQYESDLNVTKLALEATAIAAQAACDSVTVVLGEGTMAPLCAIAGAAWGSVLGTDGALRQCEWQGGAVDSALVEAAHENTRILIGRVDVVEGKIDALTAKIDGMRRVMIEEQLNTDSGSRIASYFLPVAKGGVLEEVQAIVQDTIANAQSAGYDVTGAQRWLDAANAAYAGGDWRRSYESLRRAYRIATVKARVQ
jgi:hypothetical protein